MVREYTSYMDLYGAGMMQQVEHVYMMLDQSIRRASRTTRLSFTHGHPLLDHFYRIALAHHALCQDGAIHPGHGLMGLGD